MEILKILNYLKPKKSQFRRFLIIKLVKNSQNIGLGVLLAKNHENLKKIQRSISFPEAL